MARSRARCAPPGHVQHHARHDNVHEAPQSRTGSFSEIPHLSNEAPDTTYNGNLRNYSLLSNSVYPKASSSQSPASNAPQLSGAQPAGNESPYYPNWSPVVVRLDPCFTVEPTPAECVTLPPPRSQDFQNSYSLGCRNADGSISFQQIQRFKNSITLSGQSVKKGALSNGSDSGGSTGGLDKTNYFGYALDSPSNDLVSFCCNVHVNLKNVGLKDEHVVHLIDVLEATIISLLSSPLTRAPSSDSSATLPTSNSSRVSSRKKTHVKQPSFSSSKLSLEDSSQKVSKLLLSDVVFFVSLDLSENQLSCKGVEQISEWFRKYTRYIRLRTLKLYKNSISDKGVLALAELIKVQPSALEELHLSHNNIRTAGAEALFKSIGEAGYNRSTAKDSQQYVYPRPDPTRQEFLPVWIRLEYNNITDSYGLLQKLESELRSFRGFDMLWRLVCFADRPNHPHGSKNPHCSPARCLRSVSGNAALLHLYSFYHQSNGPRAALSLCTQRTHERRKNKQDPHSVCSTQAEPLMGSNAQSKATRKCQRVVARSKNKVKQEKPPANAETETKDTRLSPLAASQKKKTPSATPGGDNRNPNKGETEQETDHTPDQPITRTTVEENEMSQNTDHSFYSPPNLFSLHFRCSSPGHYAPLEPTVLEQPEPALHVSSRSANRSCEADNSWILDNYNLDSQSGRTRELTRDIFSYQKSPTLTCTQKRQNDRSIELLDSAVVSVGLSRMHPNSGKTCALWPTHNESNDAKSVDLFHKNGMYGMRESPCTESFENVADRMRLLPDNTNGSNNNNNNKNNNNNNGSLPGSLHRCNIYRDVNTVHPERLSSAHGINLFQRPCGSNEAEGHENDLKDSPYSRDLLNSFITACSNNNSWKGQSPAEMRPLGPNHSTTQPRSTYMNESLEDKLNNTFLRTGGKKQSPSAPTPYALVPEPASPRNDDSTLYIFFDSSAYLSMRKLFTDKRLNIFSFPALAALQETGALVHTASSSNNSHTGINDLNNIKLIYLDVVKDGVKRMTEDMPFLRQSIAEVQGNFVNLLHEQHVIEKVKGLGDKASFPDWATWSKDVFDQAKLLEETAFESLRVFDFACVWEYHLNVLRQSKASSYGASAASNSARPFSIFVTGDPKVENFLVYLSERQKHFNTKSTSDKCKNKFNLVCTHVDRLNSRASQSFPELAKALRQQEFLQKDSKVSFVNTPLENILSASSVRKIMRQYFHISPDVLLDTTELISSLRDTTDNSCNIAREDRTKPPGSLPRQNVEHIQLLKADHTVREKELHILRETNKQLIKEIKQAYFLLVEVLESDTGHPNDFGSALESSSLGKDLLQRCVVQCRHWKTLLTQLNSI